MGEVSPVLVVFALAFTVPGDDVVMCIREGASAYRFQRLQAR